jgi:hypothetical protein
MDFLDTAKENATNTIHAVGVFIQKEKDPVQQAYINIFLMLILSCVFGATGYFVGFVQGGLAR